MTGPARSLVLTICAAHPAAAGTGPGLTRIPATTDVLLMDGMVCGLPPGHGGKHVDVEYVGVTWDDEEDPR